MAGRPDVHGFFSTQLRTAFVLPTARESLQTVLTNILYVQKVLTRLVL